MGNINMLQSSMFEILSTFSSHAILMIVFNDVFLFFSTFHLSSNIGTYESTLCLQNSEFQLIHELCLYVLSASQRTELIRATLATLHAFLSWIPLGYIFESPLVRAFMTISIDF